MGKGSKKNKKAKAAAAAAAGRGVIGPDYIQLISGCISGKQVNVILCGESHEDAIDVTRSGGKGKEGWVATDAIDLTAEMVGKVGGLGGCASIRVKCGMCKRKDNKLLNLGKAKEWGNSIVDDEIDYIDHGNELALLFVPSKDAGSGSKGRAYVVEVFLDESEEDQEAGQHMDKSRTNLPTDVNALIDAMADACNDFQEAKSLSVAAEEIKSKQENGGSGIVLLQWTDLDAEARKLNHRRLLGEDIATSEHDKLISDRKKKRRDEENLWAWDDWLNEVKDKLKQPQQKQQDGTDDPVLHCILEAPIPPWEVELCRDLEEGFEFSTAADCIRCMSADSSESELDAYDPSADGFGSYVDYIYRQLMKNKDHNGCNDVHCVDSRDLGCEHACVAESLHRDWMDLLQPDEKDKLLESSNHAHHKDNRWLPDWEHNPEEAELDRLRNDGVLKEEEDDDEEEDLATRSSSVHVDLITYPSFEGFFGQNTDILYYAPHCKVAYGPFLGHCATSLEVFREFFTRMFLGGTVDSALSVLDLSKNKRSYLHVRSPIMKAWNIDTGEYEWHKRNDEEHDLTFPIFPINVFLKAKNSDPPRTWSSQLFHSLQEDGESDLGNLANSAREWILNDCERQCFDPKHADDEIGGGEWFLAYLREVHRDIYDDIDHTDATTLLHKSSVVGEISMKKHKVGDITIPSCKEGFDKIVEELPRLSSAGIGGKPVLGRSTEVMAKIMIDIFMSKLVDFSTALKIAQVIAKERSDKVCIVIYMGSVHTRAISDFYCGALGFKKKTFLGKQNWPEQEARIIHLPPELWNLQQLFDR